MEKILSIIVAAYNVEEYLDNTLHSCVLNDSELYNDYEVIVMNDGSRDGTSTIAWKYAHQYPKVFRVIDKENGGYGSVINKGLQVAIGKYFKLLDGDDWYNTQALAEVVQNLKKCDSDMVLTDYAMVHQGSGKVDVHQFAELIPRTEFLLEKESCEQQKLAQVLKMHGICYKTAILRRAPIPVPEKCYYTDTEYVLFGAAYLKSVIYYPICLYQYRIGLEGQSVSIQGIKKHIMDLERVLEDIDTFYNLLQEGDNKELVNYRIALTYRAYITYLLLLPANKEIRQKIADFDTRIRIQYPERYQWMENKKIRILRISDYRAYGLCRLYCKWEKMWDES